MGTCLILLSSTVTVDHIPHVFWKHSLLLYDVQCPVSYTRLNLPLGYQWNDLQIVEKVLATSGPIAAKELSILFIYRGYVRVARWFVCSPLLTWEEFDDTKGVINIRKSQKNRQHNGQKTEDQTTQWSKDRRSDNTMVKRQKIRQHNGQKTEDQTTLLSFDHCVVWSSVFWPLCCLIFCLLTIVLSVLLSFDHCVVCSSVFWPLCCLFFCDLRMLITPLVSSD
jgi:hypothetical protein